MCGPLGQECDFIHRSWLRLAEMLCAEGLQTLRFDYRGLGDSLDDASPDKIAAWIDDVLAAVAWLKSTQDVDEVVLLGLRFGAAAAAAAAVALGGVAGLVLLAPVTSGRAYRRELTMMAKMGGKATPQPGESLSVGGVTYPPESLEHLERLEPFRDGGPLAPRILTLIPPGMKLDRTLTQRFAGSGLDTQEAEFTDFAALMVEADFSLFPAEAFARIIDWIGTSAGSKPAALTVSGKVRIELSGACEETVTLNGSAPLFGILSKPNRPQQAAPAFLFMTTGAIRHTGSGRIAVLLARRLAELGLTSLRFDIAGVGDSPDREGQRDPIEHLADAFSDVEAALDWAGARGYPGAVLVGFCRGAQLACNMAFRDRRVRGQILFAPPPFFWNDEPAHRAPNTNRRYLSMLMDPATWSSIAKGEIRPFQLVRGAYRMVSRIAGKLTGRTPADGAAERLRTLKGRGVETLLLYGDKDEFLFENEEYFSAGRDRFRERLGMETVILNGVDHQYYDALQRSLIIETIERQIIGGAFQGPTQGHQGQAAALALEG